MESVEMLSEVVLVGRSILTNCKDMKTTCLRGNSTPSILLLLHGLLPFHFDSLAHCFLFSFSFSVWFLLHLLPLTTTTLGGGEMGHKRRKKVNVQTRGATSGNDLLL